MASSVAGITDRAAHGEATTEDVVYRVLAIVLGVDGTLPGASCLWRSAR